mmetsp:Transcript_5316/g.14888  ORF Transcript_5316/g.14888 Transcript_5316/m.14888 type:complete len:212 (-) Transcript_5316:119-754(-)
MHVITNTGCARSWIRSSQPSGRGASSPLASASWMASMPTYSGQWTSIFDRSRTARCSHLRRTALSMSAFSLAAMPDRSFPGRLKSNSCHKLISPLTCRFKAFSASSYLLNKGHDTFLHTSSTSTPLAMATCHIMPCTAFALAKARSLAAACSGSTLHLDKSMKPPAASTCKVLHTSVLPTLSILETDRILRLESSLWSIMPSLPPYSKSFA